MILSNGLLEILYTWQFNFVIVHFNLYIIIFHKLWVNKQFCSKTYTIISNISTLHPNFFTKKSTNFLFFTSSACPAGWCRCRTCCWRWSEPWRPPWARTGAPSPALCWPGGWPCCTARWHALGSPSGPLLNKIKD